MRRSSRCALDSLMETQTAGHQRRPVRVKTSLLQESACFLSKDSRSSQILDEATIDVCLCAVMNRR